MNDLSGCGDNSVRSAVTVFSSQIDNKLLMFTDDYFVSKLVQVQGVCSDDLTLSRISRGAAE